MLGIIYFDSPHLRADEAECTKGAALFQPKRVGQFQILNRLGRVRP